MPPDVRMPFEMLEVSIIEKTHWTFQELDSQDTGRILRMMEIISTRDSLIAEYERSQKK